MEKAFLPICVLMQNGPSCIRNETYALSETTGPFLQAKVLVYFPGIGTGYHSHSLFIPCILFG
jgi:hypothetical protein